MSFKLFHGFLYKKKLGMYYADSPTVLNVNIGLCTWLRNVIGRRSRPVDSGLNEPIKTMRRSRRVTYILARPWNMISISRELLDRAPFYKTIFHKRLREGSPLPCFLVTYLFVLWLHICIFVSFLFTSCYCFEFYRHLFLLRRCSYVSNLGESQGCLTKSFFL